MPDFRKPTPEEEAAADKVYASLSEDDRAVISFLSFTLNEAYGGSPTIGMACEGEGSTKKISGYLFASACTCDICTTFQDWRPKHTFKDIIGAAMGYAQDKITYAKETGDFIQHNDNALRSVH